VKTAYVLKIIWNLWNRSMKRVLAANVMFENPLISAGETHERGGRMPRGLSRFPTRNPIWLSAFTADNNNVFQMLRFRAMFLWLHGTHNGALCCGDVQMVRSG
jgi:hypothetical protein